VGSIALTSNHLRNPLAAPVSAWARRRAAPGILAAGRAMAAEGLVIGTVGNVSARAGAGLVVTPTRMPYARTRARDLVVLDLDGEAMAGRRTPSREWRLHALIYRARPDVGAIVHTHSHYATAWSFRDEPLPPLEESDYYGIGPVRISACSRAGGLELAEGAVAALGDGRAALLGQHGVVATGKTPEDALVIARVVERQASIAWLLAGARAR
jgi:L-fuculose-phosphate aldolase